MNPIDHNNANKDDRVAVRRRVSHYLWEFDWREGVLAERPTASDPFVLLEAAGPVRKSDLFVLDADALTEIARTDARQTVLRALADAKDPRAVQVIASGEDVRQGALWALDFLLRQAASSAAHLERPRELEPLTKALQTALDTRQARRRPDGTWEALP